MGAYLVWVGVARLGEAQSDPPVGARSGVRIPPGVPRYFAGALDRGRTLGTGFFAS
jgi:hypothetical protein